MAGRDLGKSVQKTSRVFTKRGSEVLLSDYFTFIVGPITKVTKIKLGVSRKDLEINRRINKTKYFPELHEPIFF